MHTNWAGGHTYAAARWHEPTQLEELAELVAGAERVRVLASRHCFNDIGDTDPERGDLVSLRGLPDHIEIEPGPDAGSATVRVTPWTLYGVLGARLHAEGWALPDMASLPHISVGGAVASGTHGSGDGCGALATTVVGFDVLRPDGSTDTVERGDPDFEGQVVALGALGVWTSVRLALVPTYDLAQTVCLDLPWDRVVDGFDAVTGAAYSVSLFTDWRADHVDQVWLKARPGDPGLPDARPATAPMHMLRGEDGATCTEQLGVPGPWHLRLPHFRPEFTPSRGRELQSEYLVPRTRALAAFERLRGLGDVLAPMLQVAEIRTIAADDLWLSGASGHDVVGLHFTWLPDDDGVRVVLDHVEDAVLPLGARPHWGKVFNASAAELAGLYPRFEDFRSLRDRLDPDRVFDNAYLRRVLG